MEGSKFLRTNGNDLGKELKILKKSIEIWIVCGASTGSLAPDIAQTVGWFKLFNCCHVEGPRPYDRIDAT